MRSNCTYLFIIIFFLFHLVEYLSSLRSLGCYKWKATYRTPLPDDAVDADVILWPEAGRPHPVREGDRFPQHQNTQVHLVRRRVVLRMLVDLRHLRIYEIVKIKNWSYLRTRSPEVPFKNGAEN